MLTVTVMLTIRMGDDESGLRLGQREAAEYIR